MKKNRLTKEERHNIVRMLISPFRNRENRNVSFSEFLNPHLEFYENLPMSIKVPYLIPSRKEINILSGLRNSKLSKVEIKMHNGELKSAHETMHFDIKNEEVSHIVKRFSNGKVTVQKRDAKTSHIEVVIKKSL